MFWIKNRSGFTLIELLIVSMLTVTLLFALQHTFFQGIRVYERLHNARGYESVSFFMERLTRDLKNGARFSQIPFKGMTDSLTFGSMAIPEGSENADSAKPVQVRYEYDRQRKQVLRYQTDPQSAEAGAVAKGKVVLEDVQALKFEFKNGDTIPSKIDVTFTCGKKQNETQIRKEILIPIAHI